MRLFFESVVAIVVMAAVWVPAQYVGDQRAGLGDVAVSDLLVDAAARGDLSEVRRALRRGADPRRPDSAGALHCAAWSGNVAVVKTLLKAGAEVDLTTSSGHTALMVASRSGDEACVRALLEAGANRHACAESGISALCVAAMSGHDRIIEVLLSETRFKSEELDHALLCAVESGDRPGIVAQLMRAGASCDARNADGVSAMQIAAEAHHRGSLQVMQAADMLAGGWAAKGAW